MSNILTTAWIFRVLEREHFIGLVYEHLKLLLKRQFLKLSKRFLNLLRGVLRVRCIFFWPLGGGGVYV